MNLDSARNAKAEILRKAIGLTEQTGSTGASGLPRFVIPDDLARTAIIAEAQRNWARRTDGLGSMAKSLPGFAAMPMAGEVDLGSLGRFATNGQFEPGPDLLEENMAYSEPAATPLSLPPPIAVGIRVDGRSRDARPVMFVPTREYRDHPAAILAAQIASAEVEIYVTGPARRLSIWQPPHRRPLISGTSIAHRLVSAGTLGAFVRDSTGQFCVLSNNHVLARVNQAQIGDPILQPARRDSGDVMNDTVALLTQFVAIDTSPSAINFVDAALASLLPLETITAGFPHSAVRLQGSYGEDYLPEPDQDVIKFGRTTGYTQGRIFAFEVDNQEVNLGTDMRPIRCRFDDQIQIYAQGPAFAQPGDSGSLIMTPDGMAVGLLFAGARSRDVPGGGLTVANPIHRVLAKLGAQLWIG
jgi:hypothetical protein